VLILTSLNRLERAVRKNPRHRDSSAPQKPSAAEPDEDDEDDEHQKPPSAPNFSG
jgi:hypothetical protein